MQTGAITGYIDVAQVVLYLFWIFFAGLIYYLLRENKREGYPLESDRSSRITVQGWPSVPFPKTFKLSSGEIIYVPPLPAAQVASKPIAAVPSANWLGAPLEPTGPQMLAEVGPGSYAQRADRPDQTLEGMPRIVPLRAAPGFGVASQDPDPRGKPVVGADGQIGGIVCDLWVDRSEMIFRYLEVEVKVENAVRRVLVPMNFARVGQRQTVVMSVFGMHFAQVPATRLPEQVTLLEEEKIMAYYGAGTLYAESSRREPVL
jgi:photosynthetic reaction center H subunit